MTPLDKAREALAAVELKPCPFCGGEAIWAFPESLKGREYHGVGCKPCMFILPRRYLDKVEAAAAWNRRAEHERLTDRVAKLEGALRGPVAAFWEKCIAADDLSEDIDGSDLDALAEAIEVGYPVIWTAEQVANLDEFQKAGRMHPFTCGTKEKHPPLDDCGDVPDDELFATERGWKCPTCDYRQFWAHDFMLDGSAVKAARALLTPAEGAEDGR
jgi:Lar family restriction alleviation protein